jgi:hypothetical protein
MKMYDQRSKLKEATRDTATVSVLTHRTFV